MTSKFSELIASVFGGCVELASSVTAVLFRKIGARMFQTASEIIGIAMSCVESNAVEIFDNSASDAIVASGARLNVAENKVG